MASARAYNQKIEDCLAKNKQWMDTELAKNQKLKAQCEADRLATLKDMTAHKTPWLKSCLLWATEYKNENVQDVQMAMQCRDDLNITVKSCLIAQSHWATYQNELEAQQTNLKDPSVDHATALDNMCKK